MDKGRETAARKARELRYKKPILRELNRAAIDDWYMEAVSACADVAYSVEDDNILLAAMDGDAEAAFEFKAAFSVLEADIERFGADLEQAWIPECFDILFAFCGAESGEMGGLLGYDAFEGDYFGIESWEAWLARDAAQGVLLRMTKKDILEAARQCFRVGFSFVALRARYSELEAALEIIRGENKGIALAIKQVEEMYEGGRWEELDRAAQALPDECWIR